MYIFFSNGIAQIPKLLSKANLFYKQKKYPKAIKLYKRILKLDKTHFAAKANLATSYLAQDLYDKAHLLFQDLAKQDSLNPWWQNYLSQTAFNIGDIDQSLDAAWQAVLLAPDINDHHLNLGYTIYEIADSFGVEKIISVLQKWYNQFPTNPIAEQSYKSFFYDAEYIKSNPQYIEYLFDVFADEFDNVLAELDYSVPKILAQILSIYLQQNPQLTTSILDLGCGSGLCASAIKNKLPNSTFFGVDISAKMLAKAQAKKIYNALFKYDISECFNKLKIKANIIVSADVLTYFGRLDELFSKIYAYLPAGGIFAFSISLNFINDDDYFLLPDSRFVHSPKYIKQLLNNTGFFVVEKHDCKLRKEGDKDIMGSIILAIKQ